MELDETQKSGKPQLHSKRVGRELAMQFLFQNDLNQIDPRQVDLDAFCEEAGMTLELPANRVFRKGREYATMLILGIADHQAQIDDTLKQFSEKWDLDRMAIVDRNIMRVAVYEMLFVPEVPPIVSINEAVGIARDYSGGKSGNFINGVLNGIKDTLKRPARNAVKEL
jgi:N utilization substance protein B